MSLENYKDLRNETIREILLYVCEHKDMPPDSHRGDKAKIVKECVDAGYLENVRTMKDLSGDVYFAAAQPFVTKAGLAFLFPENDQDATGEAIVSELTRMNGDVRQNHAEEKSEKEKDRRFQLLNTLFGALLGAVFTLLVEHFGEIIKFFQQK